MEKWLLAYFAVSLVATVLWCVNRAAMVAFVKSVFVVGLVWLVAGCAVTSVPVPKGLDLSDRVTVDLCVAGKDRPDLVQVLVDEADKYGIDLNPKPLPPHQYYKDQAMMWAAVSDCPIIADFNLPTGYGVGCVLVACQAGFTYARVNRLDAVMRINWGLPSIVRHEFIHAMGCGHGNNHEGCAAQIAMQKERLRT